MIEEFLSTWSLFSSTYLAGWLVAFILAVTGVLVVAEDHVFIGAAVAQASAFGVALALSIGVWAGAGTDDPLRSSAVVSGAAVVFSIAAALMTARTNLRRESREAVTGWVFLASASGSILLVSRNPRGTEEIQHLMSSSILGATPTDVWFFSILAGATAVLLALTHRRLLLVVIDPPMAAAVGMRPALWSAGWSCWLGLVIGLSIRSSGMLYVFGCLVLPAMIAKTLCREVIPMFLVAPAVALATTVAAFVLANYYDFPPGQMAVSLLAIVYLCAALVRKVRAR